ncbi:unnamed protein product [Rhizoctonia solani]|uniref:Uncharacterized protein n=1 Tax=Rhizoctonia solani TaxID=456999 RepID=A0A8H3DXC9_9AGAM|nr:unnamed protein product [Rhizoctonia solani]
MDWPAFRRTLIQAGICAAVGGSVVAAAVLVTPLLGFTASGVAAGSLAAAIQSAFYGAAIPAGSLFAILQSIGATGVLVPAITAGLGAAGIAGLSRIAIDVLARAYQAAAADLRKILGDIYRGLMIMGALSALDMRRIVGGVGAIEG